MPSVRFFAEDVQFKLSNSRSTADWIRKAIQAESFQLNNLNFIFCSDEYLADLNKTYLNHDTYTDIVTFDNSDQTGDIEADIFISIDRVRDNAIEHNSTFENEIHRVLIHGVLHLCGYKDKTSRQKSEMRQKEDSYLSLRVVPRGTK